MKRKEKDQGPLNLSEWVQYLTFEQNRERADYSNTEVSILTKTIMMLAIINSILIILTILNTFDFISLENKVLFFVGTCLFLIVMIIILLIFFRKLSNFKKTMDDVMNIEARIIEDILNGKLKDTNEIRKRYMKIWGN